MSASALSYTPEQARAIETRGLSVTLSAGAGCGKTFVLTERFLADLDPQQPGDLPQAELRELVAITFTERAAREMRDRIRRKCLERLRAAKGDDVAWWQSLLRSLDGARVSTIHSFCAALLRSHAVEAGLDPRFTVLEQAQADTLAAELADDRLRAGLAARDGAILDLVADFGVDKLRRMLLWLLGRRTSIDFDRWLAATPDEQLAAWETFQASSARRLVAQQLAASHEAQSLLALLRQNEVPSGAMQERKATLLDLLPRLARSERPVEDLQAIRAAAMLKGDGGKKVWDNVNLREAYAAAADKLRKAIDKLPDLEPLDREAARPAAEAGLRLLHLADEIAVRYEEEKRRLRQLDFADLVLRATRLLDDPAHADLRERLARHVRLLMVDEFQDTDRRQLQLVRALAGDDYQTGGLFVVGDRKQSIYRFRGADPDVFDELREEIPAEGRMPLTLNFRSQPAILSFVNGLFAPVFGESYESLRPHRTQTTPLPAIEFLWATTDENKKNSGATARARRREADWIARRLRELIDGGAEIVAEETPDGPRARGVAPGDVAILFRALTDVAFYEEALRSHNLDYYLVGGHAFYAQQEIFDLTNLLRAVASPADEVSLAGALRSPFFALADEALFWLVEQQGSLAAGLAAAPPRQLDAEQRRRVAFAAGTLDALRRLKDRLPIAELIREALARTGYDATLVAEFLGMRKLANLDKLIDAARGFDRNAALGLDDFLVQLSQFIAQQPHEPLAATQSETTSVIRLMTIHQAKGLEFPVVVVPDIDRRGGSRGESVDYHRELGPVVQPEGVDAVCGSTLHKLVATWEDERERERQFYVACTRAADYLILSSSLFRGQAPQGLWTRTLARGFELDSGRFRGEPPAGNVAPEVRVTDTQPLPGMRPASGRRSADWEKLLRRAEGAAPDAVLPATCRPVAVDTTARRRFSFSRLTGLLHGPAAADGAPAARRDVPDDTDGPPPIDPLGLGSLVHAVLEHVDFARSDVADVAPLVARFAPRHFKTTDSAAAANEATELIARFLQSERAAALAAAAPLHAELEFLLGWPPGEPRPGDRYLEGVIDALYRPPAGGWHLLDYKTNQVTAENLDATAEAYRMQLGVYALAVEQVLGEPPVELALHFLRGGLEKQFPWDDAARAETIAWVNQALAAAVEQEKGEGSGSP